MAKWTAATRKAYHAHHPENFAGPDMSYPIKDKSDVGDAWGLAGHADNPDAVRAKIKAIAKRLGFSDALPDTAKEDGKASTAENAPFSSPTIGKSKIATLTTCFIEDGAVSLNGRQYPREAVDRLIQSAQLQLSDPNAAPLTCYISHDAADQDDSLKLAGKLTGVWREGTKGMASIDIVNTSAGRDMAMQSVGGFLKTMSLRASNAEIKREKDSTWPIVGGHSLRLDGIDFTATPGISVAKIQNVALAENAYQGPQRLHEVFNAHAHTLQEYGQKEDKPMPENLNEADQGGNTIGGYSPTSGNSPSMTSDPTKDSYGARMYNKPDDTTGGPMQGMAKQGNPIELQEAHDRIAMVQGRSCAPGRESARWKMAFAGLEESDRKLVEAGRSLSSKNDAHLDVAHHAVAKHLGMECAEKNNKMSAQPANDGLQDGDDDDRQSHRAPTHKESTHMTPEQAEQLLRERGYSIEKPKSEADQLREQLEAMKAEQAKQLEEMRNLFAQNQPAPQRKSVVLGANVGAQQSTRANVYQPGNYLKEQIAGADWSMLADRTAPLPEAIDLTLLIREFTDLRVIQNFDRYGWPENLANAVDRL